MLSRALRHLAKLGSIHIDNIFFCFHYKLTVLLLFAFSILFTLRRYFGEHISCQFDDYKSGELNTYCFRGGTYVRDEIPKHVEVGGEHTMDDQVRYCRYYGWVATVLLLQACCFYIPRYLWEACEGGRIEALSNGITSPILDDDVVENGAERLSKYFLANFHTHNRYAYQYFACELLNLINVIGQIFFMHRFIGEGYQFYGLYFLFLDRNDMENRIGQLFPIKTICGFEKYSRTGVKEKVEGVCLLTINMLNEYAYAFLWLWMHFVAIISILLIIHRVATMSISRWRLFVLRLLCSMTDPHDIHAVYEKLQIGDWFLLLLLEKNINPQVFKALMSRLANSPQPDVSIR